MKLNALSYFAGIGTVVAALSIGFGGALLITGSNQKTETQNRLQQVMSHGSSPAQKLAATEIPPSSSSQSPLVVEQPLTQTLPTDRKQDEPPTVVQPADFYPDLTQNKRSANRAKNRQAEVQRAVERENQRKRFERNKRQEEIDAATTAVRRMLRDNRAQQVVQNDNINSARGFFGGDN